MRKSLIYSSPNSENAYYKSSYLHTNSYIPNYSRKSTISENYVNYPAHQYNNSIVISQDVDHIVEQNKFQN